MDLNESDSSDVEEPAEPVEEAAENHHAAAVNEPAVAQAAAERTTNIAADQDAARRAEAGPSAEHGAMEAPRPFVTRLQPQPQDAPQENSVVWARVSRRSVWWPAICTMPDDVEHGKRLLQPCEQFAVTFLGTKQLGYVKYKSTLVCPITSLVPEAAPRFRNKQETPETYREAVEEARRRENEWWHRKPPAAEPLQAEPPQVGTPAADPLPPAAPIAAQPQAAASPVWWSCDDDEVLRKKWAEVLFCSSMSGQEQDVPHWLFTTVAFEEAFPLLATPQARFEAVPFLLGTLRSPDGIVVEHLKKLRRGAAKPEHLSFSTGQKRRRDGSSARRARKVWVEDSGVAFYTDESGRVLS